MVTKVGSQILATKFGFVPDWSGHKHLVIWLHKAWKWQRWEVSVIRIVEKNDHVSPQWVRYGLSSVKILASYKSQNASNKYLTMDHFVTVITTRAHISVTKWCIVLWDMGLVHYRICATILCINMAVVALSSIISAWDHAILTISGIPQCPLHVLFSWHPNIEASPSVPLVQLTSLIQSRGPVWFTHKVIAAHLKVRYP